MLQKGAEWGTPRHMPAGVGFIAELDKRPTRSCVTSALEMLLRMTHRGACGCEVNSGASRSPGLRGTQVTKRCARDTSVRMHPPRVGLEHDHSSAVQCRSGPTGAAPLRESAVRQRQP